MKIAKLNKLDKIAILNLEKRIENMEMIYQKMLKHLCQFNNTNNENISTK